MTRLVLVLTFLALITEPPTMYSHLVRTPLGDMNDIFFAPGALKLPIFGYVLVLLILFAGKRSKDPPIAAMKRAVLIGTAAMIFWSLLGLARGGIFQQVPWQTYPYIQNTLFFFVIIEVIRTPANIESLGKTLIAAALWRSGAAIVFYWTTVRTMTDWRKVPPCMTTHDDTTLFCTALVILILYAVHERRKKPLIVGGFLSMIILYAVQLNGRRLAWVSLIAGFIVAYFVLPPSPLKRKINRRLLLSAPVLALYVLVGTGRPEKIFKPLQALNSMDAKHDNSTASREAENDNLMATWSKNTFIGTGWGHPFDVVNNTFALDGIFDQWKFLPHNSFFGLLAFTGIFGVASIWWPIPASVYISSRAYRVAPSAVEKTAAATAVAEVVIYANQTFGDMGFGSPTGLILLASAYTCGSRIAALHGAWRPIVKGRAQPAGPARPARASAEMPQA